jgi:hypothetical protein
MQLSERFSRVPQPGQGGLGLESGQFQLRGIGCGSILEPHKEGNLRDSVG